MAHETDNKEHAAPEMREIAAAGVGVQFGGLFLDELAKTSDDILRARGGDLSLYKKVLSDDQVFSTFQQRRLAVISRPWDVQPGGDAPLDQAAADFLKEQLDHIRWDRVTLQMMFGIFYGYAVAECLWGRDGGRITLEAIKVRERRRFRFSQKDGALRLLTRDAPAGVVMPPAKFWTFNTGADNDDEPLGLGLAHWLYWPVLFKRNGMKFWLVFLEKFGMPTAKGEYPPNTSEAEQKKLLEAVTAIQQDAGIIVPQGMIIELLEAARSGTGDYAALHARMEAAVAKVVLSQTMTTESGSSRSQAQVHMDVRQEVVEADSGLICESFEDGPAHWLTQWNFPGARTPRVIRKFEDERDIKDQAEIDKTVFDMGFAPSEERIKEIYGDGWVKRENAGATDAGPAKDPQPPGDRGGAAFTEPPDNDDSLDRFGAALLAEGAGNDLIKGLVDPVRRLIEEADSLDEVRDRIIELVDQADDKALIELLARAGFAARVAGEVGAKTTDRE